MQVIPVIPNNLHIQAMAEQVQVQIPRVKLGSHGFEVSKLGFGCMGLTGVYNSPVSEEAGIAIIKHAFNRGITFFDTSNVYGPHTNEILLGKALKQLPREKIQVATKFGIVGFDEKGVVVNGKPEYVRACCEESLERLGVDYIDLYYQHRIDKTVPIEETMGELKKLVEEGKVKYIGLSEASPNTIRRAHAVHPITAIQMEWSLWTRDIEPEIVPLCRELSIGIVPYSPIGRGFFAGRGVTENLPSDTNMLLMLNFYLFFDVTRLISKDSVVRIWKRTKFFICEWRIWPRNIAAALFNLLWLGFSTKVMMWFLFLLLLSADSVFRNHPVKDHTQVISWEYAEFMPSTTKVKNLDVNIESLKVKLAKEDSEELSDAVREEEVAGSRSYGSFEPSNWKYADTPPMPANPSA
ncbi:hypothetical protein ZIOFF_047312 [Zingiber officinale]|uniref:NADP-dependent oxidoreductase domain-containing protein n=1 Tax=Zingiber officinale TaxID=94328 RepID=A0A8J5G5Y0_ZINOF|nr:hypothetical protein ZIOFF_047312 [Zingiber officinale]